MHTFLAEDHTAGGVSLGADRLKVLAADDDRVVRRIVVTKLSGLGYEVTDVEDGQEALGLLEGGQVPDLLITDSLMPRMNGLQLVRAIRQSPDPRLATLPVIMLTSRQGEHDIIEGLEAGLDDYIIKPFSPDELAARVRSVLWRARREPGG
jgi:DNA-binding response OmpR family regulator